MNDMPPPPTENIMKCNACGFNHATRVTFIRKQCPYTKLTRTYCDNKCFKWRYFDFEKHEPKRYDLPKYFALREVANVI